MVGKVLQWKRAQPDEAQRVWTELGRSNEALRDTLVELSARAKEDPAGYKDEVRRLAALPASEVGRARLSACRACRSLTTLPARAVVQLVLTLLSSRIRHRRSYTPRIKAARRS